MAEYIYKIFTSEQWQDFKKRNVFKGAPVDLADGYIHFSAAHQVAATAAKHFAGAEGLVLAALSSSDLNGAALKWEASRGGDLFPHLYGVLDAKAVVQSWHLRLDSDGQHIFPKDAGIIEVS